MNVVAVVVVLALYGKLSISSVVLPVCQQASAEPYVTRLDKTGVLFVLNFKFNLSFSFAVNFVLGIHCTNRR